MKIFFRVSGLGPLKITSGRVVVADAFVGVDQKPMANEIPNGDYPVRLAVLQGTMGRGRVAFARVDFSSAPAVRWEPAMPDEYRRDAENPDGQWGFPVDSGLAAFFDPVIIAAVQDGLNASDDFFDAWLEKGQNAGAKEPGTTGAFRLVADIGPANIVAFDAGWGDGAYAVYAGFDAQGNIAAMIADFDILDWSKVKE